MEFAEIVRARYAVKTFDEKKVDEKKINELLEIIRHAPSSFNIQPWHIVVVKDDKLKETLAPAAWNQPQITTCSHLLVFCARTDLKEHIDRLRTVHQTMPSDALESYLRMMHDFEAKMSPQQKLSWAQRQTYLALGNAVNGAKSLGFDSCPMEGFDPAQFATLLNLPSHIIPTALCALGYAADTPRPKARFPLKETFSFR